VVLASVLQAVSPASRVWAIDPHDGQVGASDQGFQNFGPTFDQFLATLAAAGVSDTVEPVVKHSYDVPWHEPIDLLFVDGLHDYDNVARDFRHFEPWIADGGLILFHDYASYFPGVVAFVDELLAGDRYRRVDAAESLIALQKTPAADRPPPQLLKPSRLFQAMRATPGWFDEAEGELLLSATLHAASAERDCCNILEIGSYCGRSTIVLAGAVQAVAPSARVWAVDPHEGEVGAADQRLHTGEPTLEQFRRNLTFAGVAGVVETVVRRSYDVEWHRPIHMLLLDGLHDFANVSRDFLHFEPWLADGALILFHDYATYYPGVMAFVDHLLVQGSYRFLEQAGSLVLLQKVVAESARVSALESSERRTWSAAVQRDSPLVSCIMATADRPELVPKAIEYFRRQDYPALELVIVDNGLRGIEPSLLEDARVRYVRSPKRLTLAAAHNLACETASGEIICHWDDDDWMAPWRVSYQVQDLLRADEDTICGLSTLLFYEPMERRAWRYQYPQHARPWLSGATFCYRKRFWEQHPFPDQPGGADTTLVWGLPPSTVRAHADTRFIVATVHRSNTSARRVNVPPFQPWSSEDVEALLGADLGFYLRWPRT
jgi:predicted O-methyltransferase YrrM